MLQFLHKRRKIKTLVIDAVPESPSAVISREINVCKEKCNRFLETHKQKTYKVGSYIDKMQSIDVVTVNLRSDLCNETIEMIVSMVLNEENIMERLQGYIDKNKEQYKKLKDMWKACFEFEMSEKFKSICIEGFYMYQLKERENRKKEKSKSNKKRKITEVQNISI